MNARTQSAWLLAAALLGPASCVRAEMRLGQERFFGRGTRGPYTIARRGVEDRTASVRLNGRHLQPGQDYLFNADMGAMSFTESVRPSDVVEVDYQYDTAKARDAGPSGGTLGLMSFGGGGLALSYNFKSDKAGNQQLSDLGFTGEALVGGANVTSLFMMDKAAGGGADAQNIQMAAKDDTGPFKYTMGYSHVGKKFGQAEAMKLARGSEALNLAGSLQLSSRGLMSFQRTRTELTDAKTGVTTSSSVLAGNMTMNLAEGSRLTALHEEKADAKGKDETSSRVDRLQLDQKLGGAAAATLIQETVSNEKNGQGETVTATRLNATATADGGVKVETALAMTDSSKTGDARDAALKVTRENGGTKVTLAMTDRQADSGDVRTHLVGVETRASGGLKLFASSSGDRSDKGANTRSTLGVEGGTTDRLRFSAGVSSDSGAKSGTGTRFALSSRPTTGLKLSASRSDDPAVNGDASSTRLAMDFAGGHGVKLVASYAGDDNGVKSTEATRLNLEAKPTDAVKLVASHVADNNEKGDIASTKVNVEASGAKGLKIAAAYLGDENGKTSKESAGLNIEARPTDVVKLTASLGGKSDEKGEAQTHTVGVEAKPTQALQLAASYGGGTDEKGPVEASRLAIAAQGDKVKVSASYAGAMAAAGDSSVAEAAVSLAPVKDKLSFSGSFRDEQKQDKSSMQVAVLQADIKPGDRLAMSGFYKSRDNGGPDQINTVNAQVTVGSDKRIQMIGTYSANPEEKDQILRLVRRGLSLKTNIGGLSFTGGYMSEESLVDNAEGARAEFKLGLRLSKNAQLQGGFQQTVGAVRGYKPMLAYNMKYNHNVGQDFHLALDADVVQRDNTVPANQRNEVKATANLGMRF